MNELKWEEDLKLDDELKVELLLSGQVVYLAPSNPSSTWVADCQCHLDVDHRDSFQYEIWQVLAKKAILKLNH